MVVWQGETSTSNEEEIFGQRVLASDGSLQGTNFQVSDRGTPGSADFDAELPDIAYNATDDEFYVVYWGDRIPGEDEIFGLRVTPAGGFPGGTRSEERLSFMGVDNNVSFDAERPSVAWSATDNQYLVVWDGDVTTINNEEIFGQRVAGRWNTAIEQFPNQPT